MVRSCQNAREEALEDSTGELFMLIKLHSALERVVRWLHEVLSRLEVEVYHTRNEGYRNILLLMFQNKPSRFVSYMLHGGRNIRGCRAVNATHTMCQLDLCLAFSHRRERFSHSGSLVRKLVVTSLSLPRLLSVNR